MFDNYENQECVISDEEREELGIKEKHNPFIDYRFYLLSLITIGFILLAVFVFKNSYIRLIHSFKDVGLSFAYYFCELFGFEYSFVPSVTVLDDVYTSPLIDIPTSSESFGERFGYYFSSLWNLESLLSYLAKFLSFIANFSRWLLILLPLVFIFWWLFKRYFVVNSESIDDDESLPLHIYKKTVLPFHLFIKGVIKNTKAYYDEHTIFKKLWIIIWLLNFNIVVIAIEFFAFYFYFILSFNVGNLYIQLYKLLLDLKVIPLFIYLIGFAYLLSYLRKKYAYMKLNHYEMRNRGFLNSLGLVVLITGVTGKGKTLLMTDLTLSQEMMYRDKAFEKIMNNDVKFPNFTFATYESELKRAIQYHQVYSLATAEIWILKKRYRFEKNQIDDKIFGYEFNRYGLYHYDGLTMEYIFDMLEKYTKLFFIYTIESSLVLSNYGIRVDNSLESANHFPMWNSNFFTKSYEESMYFSRHSHIIDFDMLRLGKKVVQDNPLSDSVEFGIYTITEFDKERGNQLTNQSFKADSEAANPKNDLTELCEKIHRHSATVDNYPFIRIFTDSQRAMSVMADNREIAEKIVNITDVGDDRNALFLFTFDEILYDFFLRRFEKYYYRYRYARSDNTLFMYFFHKICAFFIDRFNKKVNTFGYAIYSGSTDKSTLDGQGDTFKWYRLNKKIYADRYKSNCFKDYWNEKALRSPVGINDLQEYVSTQATIGELKLQHSYWIDKLNDVLDK